MGIVFKLQCFHRVKEYRKINFLKRRNNGCTGMDIISLLRKAGKHVNEFKLRVEGEISPQPPIEYNC
jgi:hypothetical protein